MKQIFKKEKFIKTHAKYFLEIPAWVNECDGNIVENGKVTGCGVYIGGKSWEYEVLPEWCETIEGEKEIINRNKFIKETLALIK